VKLRATSRDDLIASAAGREKPVAWFGRRQWIASGLVLASSRAARAEPPGKGISCVYHVDEGDAQATRAIVYVLNHLDASPGVHIVVLGHSDGVKFLVRPRNAAANGDFAAAIGALQNRGVVFDACRNSLGKFGMAPSDVIQGVHVVPSGVGELARLQAREGFGYIKP